MRISIFGLGYVGTVCAVCLAKRGHTIIGVEKSKEKVHLINSARSPIIERGIDSLVKDAVEEGRLTATLNAADAVLGSDISIVCVGTPSKPNGALSLHSLETVAMEIGEAIRKKGSLHRVVLRSTVVPGTTRKFFFPRLAGAARPVSVGLAFNPEFLREGSAVSDFENPSKTVVAALDHDTAATVTELYDGLPGAKLTTEVETAELVKYVDNAWHALKVAFGNEIGVVAKALDVDSHEVMEIFFQDTRLNISNAYLRPGFAFGGSCLPKDLRALTYLGRRLDLHLPLINHILDSNRMLIEKGVDWILSQSRRRIAFLGISFKKGTDDVRESPYVELIERLIGKGLEVRIFDPNFRLSQLLGANKNYILTTLPHIADLVVPKVGDAIDWAETIVLTTNDAIYLEALSDVRPDQVVLDFARVSPNDRNIRTEGFLW